MDEDKYSFATLKSKCEEFLTLKETSFHYLSYPSWNQQLWSRFESWWIVNNTGSSRPKQRKCRRSLGILWVVTSLWPTSPWQCWDYSPCSRPWSECQNDYRWLGQLGSANSHVFAYVVCRHFEVGNNWLLQFLCASFQTQYQCDLDSQSCKKKNTDVTTLQVTNWQLERRQAVGWGWVPTCTPHLPCWDRTRMNLLLPCLSMSSLRRQTVLLASFQVIIYWSFTMVFVPTAEYMLIVHEVNVEVLSLLLISGRSD